MGRVEAESGQSQEISDNEMTQLSNNINQLLKAVPISKSGVAAALGLSEVTGHLNRNFKTLLNKSMIQYTTPENSKVDFKKIMRYI
jgi:hypothetical protein